MPSQRRAYSPPTTAGLARSEAGVSLIEVFFAITLFAIIASSLGAATVGSMKSNATSRDTSSATTLLYDKVDQLRSLNAKPVPPDLTAGLHTDPLNPLTELGTTGGSFQRTWRVTTDTPRVGMSEVVVTVIWMESTPKKLSVTTYVCRSDTCS